MEVGSGADGSGIVALGRPPALIECPGRPGRESGERWGGVCVWRRNEGASQRPMA